MIRTLKTNQMEKARQDFPGGAVDKNPSANARDTGSIPVQKTVHVAEQLSSCTTTTEPVLRNREVTAMRSPRFTTIGKPLLTATGQSNEDPVQSQRKTKKQGH